MAKTVPDPEVTRSGRAAGEPSGWIVFAATMLFIAGMFDAIWGLGAVLNDQVVTVGGRGVIVWDITVWGWFHLFLGAALVGTSIALFAMKGWARWAGIFFAVPERDHPGRRPPAFPIWALVVIALDVIVIYQLTARWDPAY